MSNPVTISSREVSLLRVASGMSTRVAPHARPVA